MANYQENQAQFDPNMTLPRRNVDWTEAIVKWTRYDYVAIYDYPTAHNDEVVQEIFKGDVIQVSRRYRREDWCLCQVGHVLGWVFLPDVRFIVPRTSSRNIQREQRHHQTPFTNSSNEDETAQATPVYHNSDYELQTEPAQYVEPEPAPVARQTPAVSSDKKPIIQRLIKFFNR